MSSSSHQWMEITFFPSVLRTDFLETLLWERSQTSSITLCGGINSHKVLFLSLISSGMLIPFALGTVCEVVKPFNVGKL